MEVFIEDQGEYPGIAEVLDDLKARGMQRIEPLTLIETASRQDIPAAVVNNALLLAARLFGRTIVPGYELSDVSWFLDKPRVWLPRQKVMVPWFESHAPHGGTVQVQLTTEKTSSSQFGLDIYGAAIGTRRSAKVTVTNVIQPVDFCTRHLIVLEATPYRWPDFREWQLDNVVVRGPKREPIIPCPACSIHPDQINVAEYVLGEEYLDIQAMPVAETVGKKFFWHKGFNFAMRSLPFSLRESPSAAIGFSVQSSVTWEFAWLFQAGFIHQAYRRRGMSQEIPPMWAYE